MLAQQSGHPLDALEPVLDEATLQQLQAHCEKVTLSRPMVSYISELVRATREHDQVRMGASPRGSLALMQASRAMALLTGHKAVTPDVVQRLLEPVLAHRLVFRDAALMRAENREAFWQNLREQVPVPDHPEASAQAATTD